MQRLLAAGIATILAFAPAGCSKGAASPVTVQGGTNGASFDAERAWQHLMKQVEFGPRPSGSTALERQRAWMTEHLEALGHTVVREAFTEQTIVGPIEYANLYVDLPPTRSDADAPELVILATHFDTKSLNFRFVGANDGASGTAVLLEFARIFTHAKAPERDYTLRLLFLDGEEAIGEWDPISKNNTYGSRYHARRLEDAGRADDVRACIVLDMVGDADLQLATDLRSDRQLLELVFATAREMGFEEYVDGVRKEILDDHLSFQAVGIPSVDLIDAEYGPVSLGSNMGAYWHTAEDVPARCSPESLDVIGRLVLRVLPKLNR
ncbi:MAG: M28 family peptidase [Planctomycetota bacterium]